MSENEEFLEYFDYRDTDELIEESPSEPSVSKSAIPSTSTSKRSSFSAFSAFTDQESKRLKLSKGAKSFVWNYFEKIEDSKVQCKVPTMKNGKEEPCNITYKFTGSTSTLKYHLNMSHNKTEGDEEKKVKFNFFININYEN
jgi:hypothetical protein